MADWDVISSTPVKAADPWAVQTEAKVNPAAVGHFDKTLEGLKRVGGEAGALADFVLSAPGFLVGVGAQLGGTVKALAEGSREPYAQGREVGRTVSEPLMNPVKKVLDLFRSGEAYENAMTTKGLEKLSTALEDAGIWAEKASGGRIARDAVPMFAETLMAGAVGLGGKAKPFVPEHVTKAMRAQIERMREEGETAAATERAAQLTPQEDAARQPVQEQINSMLGIRTPVEQAKVTRERRKDLNNIGQTRKLTAEEQTQLDLAESRGVREYGTPEESAFYADERTQQRDAATQERVGQADILRIMQKPGFERTPEDLITLRAARQEGKATPEALALLGAAGIGAVAGAELDDEALRGAALGGLIAMGFVLPHLGRGPSVPSKMGQGGAVKGPGGMWHPEAVERLSQPLKHTLSGPEETIARQIMARNPVLKAEFDAGNADNLMKEVDKERAAVDTWADKAIRNYLNKYAGTERDPLKDVEIPFGEGVSKIGELTDVMIGKESMQGPRGPEDQFGLRNTGTATMASNAFKSYLSHAGDFARQNIPPEKLAQYDLVRLIKETAANDKRVAKEMEKAATESSKDLPVYKEYPDGMKWVELKLPEKLTEEQAKGVRPLTAEELKSSLAKDGRYPTREQEGKPGYVAVDAAGKPIENSYTGGKAIARTPEEAYLAGQLAQEGNQMGTCVGGYCEGVASGESKIYSLRDKKGLSHVTIEVAPKGALEERTHSGQRYTEDTIEQIKGKQNRAPVAEYLPYVQDFVKGGKWGEVGDLENTGLRRTQDGYLTSEEIKAKGLKPVQDGAGGILHVRPEERGSIDQQLLMGLGAIGLGGLVGSSLTKDPIDGAILGMIAAGVLGFTKAGRARALDAVEKADYGVGVISTRLSNHAPELGFAIRGLDERVMKLVGDRVEQAIPAMKAVAKLPPKTAEAFDIAAFNGDAAKIAEIAKGNPALVSGLRQLRNVYDAIGKEAVSMNRFKAMLPTYFPRAIKDFPGLKEKIGEIYGTENLGKLELALRNANETAIVSRGAPLSAAEQSVLLNRELQAFKRPDTGHLPGYAKARTIKEITPELLPFYHSFAESAFQHISSATKDLENAKFFGRDLITSKGAGGREFTNVDRSIGNYLGRLIAEGKLDKAAEQEVTSILESRFKGGERSPDWWASQVRGIGHLTLLGNLPSAIVQLGDPFMAFYAHGPQATIASVARQLTGNSRISVKDYHLSDHISQEFLDASRTIPAGKLAQAGLIGGGAVAGMVLADDKLVGALGGAALGFVAAVGTANAVNKAFRTSGFTAIDSFGKNVQLNAALTKYENWAQTKLGQAKIAKKYQRAFEEDFPQLVEDLRTGNITENVRTLLFNELADMQPISKSEMSQLWLDHPNAGRLAMTLKTFMQKQLDIARRDGYNKIKEGNKAEGIRNLTALALTLGISGAAANTIKQFIMGEKVTFGPEDVYENILKTVGLSEYTRDKIRQAPIKAVGSMFVPPIAIMDQIITRDPKAVKAIPIIGKLYYSWELGGKEEVEIREAQKAKKQGKEVDLSERAIEYRTQKREAAREKGERALQ